MKRENLGEANKLDYTISEIETAIKGYKSNLENDVTLPIPGVSRISLSLPATKQVIEVIISDLEIQQHLLEKELLELE